MTLGQFWHTFARSIRQKQKNTKDMTTQIKVTAENFDRMGWNIEDSDRELISYLEICNDPERRKIKAIGTAPNGSPFDMGYWFDYYEALQDLYDYDLLPCGVGGVSSAIYNDDESQTSAQVFPRDITEIIGDTSWPELMLYRTFNELNLDLSNCSFSHPYDEPVYEMQEN